MTDNQGLISNLMLFNKTIDVKTKATCPLSGKDAPVLDYKNIELLKGFISQGGRILPARLTSVCRKKQRKLAKCIKIARVLALLPFTAK
jgi:small subunit ribosomal protein S18